MVLITLFSREQKGQTGGVTLGQIAALCPVNYDYVKARLGVWCKWHYLERNLSTANGKPAYESADRGRNFVNLRIPDDKLAEYVQMIKDYRQTIKAA